MRGYLEMRNLAVFLCFLFSGCVHVHEYPDDWPPLKPVTGDCPDILGMYVEIGRTSERPTILDPVPVSQTNPSLMRHLLDTDLVGIKAVGIAQLSENSLVVSAIDAAGMSTPHTFERENRDYHCDDGKIWLRPPWGWGPLAKRSKTLGFSKTTDGSLVLEYRSKDFDGTTVIFKLWPAYVAEEITAN